MRSRLRRGAIRTIGGAAAALGAALCIAGCSNDDQRRGATIIRGTTDRPVNFDPAGVYDLPSAEVLNNVYQTLLAFRPNATEPTPDAAERCRLRDPTAFECRLREGLRFSDGSPLTAEDVKFSFDRNAAIEDSRGAASLLANLARTDAPDARTVVFRLREPDPTFRFVLALAPFSIVPSDVFPRDRLQPNDRVVGSGRYRLVSYRPGQQTVLEANRRYRGADPPRNRRVVFQYFDKPAALKLAIERGEVDLAYRSFSPTQIADLRRVEGLGVVEGRGAEIRYLVFNLRRQPGSGNEQKRAIRQAVAQSVDRRAIATNVYDGNVTPLYSMVPEGIPNATRAFAERYGERPDPNAARRTLEAAGVTDPVELELWWTPSHYGPVSSDEFAELKRQLEAAGLFRVRLRSAEWAQYLEAARTDRYPQFQLGWFPDYPDADIFTSPFFARESFPNNHYDSLRMQRLLQVQKRSTDPAQRTRTFREIQALAAADVPTIPLWQATPVTIVRGGIRGVEGTMDPTYVYRFWLISRE